MGRKLSGDKIREILDLSAKGLSYRQIQKIAGVRRETVAVYVRKEVAEKIATAFRSPDLAGRDANSALATLLKHLLDVVTQQPARPNAPTPNPPAVDLSMTPRKWTDEQHRRIAAKMQRMAEEGRAQARAESEARQRNAEKGDTDREQQGVRDSPVLPSASLPIPAEEAEGAEEDDPQSPFSWSF